MVFVSPSGPPPNVRVLQRLATQYATENGLAVGKVQKWISFAVLAGALGRVRVYDGDPAFIIKGGVAIEQRLGNLTRATKDFDSVYQDTETDLLAALDEAFAEPYGNFTLRRAGEPEHTANATRITVKLAYLSKSWGTIPLEISGPEGTPVPPETVPTLDLSLFGLDGPDTFPCLPLRRQIAQKLHAVTDTLEDGRDNPRFRDLFDLYYLRGEVPLDRELRAECKQIFRLRKRHVWPPEIVVYESWLEPFAAMALGAAADVEDVYVAAEAVRHFIENIERLAQRTLANEFSEIPNTLRDNTDLRDAVYELVGTQPMRGKVTEEPERLERFRRIMERLVAREIDIEEAIRKTEEHLTRRASQYANDNSVFPQRWAERLVRTQYSRFYNQAVMEDLLADGHTHCFVPHSRAEKATSSCTIHLAGAQHEIRPLYTRLLESYGEGHWDPQPKIPDHPRCTHVVVPVDHASGAAVSN